MGAASQNRLAKPTNAHSCVRCFKRKVKCDKQRPSGSCNRHNAECMPRVPNPPRLRKERHPEDVLVRRIEHYEALLRESGVVGSKSQAVPDKTQDSPANTVSIDDSPQLPTPASKSGFERQFTKPQLVYKHGKSKYLDNNIWTRAIEEVK